MATTIIGSIVCTPPNPMIGESVLVEVHPPDGATFDAVTRRQIRIDGVPGTRNYLQFVRPGANVVRVQAIGPQGPEEATAEVRVQAPAEMPKLELRPGAAAPLAAHLWAEIGVPLLQVGHLAQQPHAVGFAVGQSMLLARNPGVATLSSRSLHVLPSFQLPGAGKTALYEWDFGDGGKLGTMTPTVRHDYSGSLDPLTEYQQFDVTVASAGRQVTRTLTFCNLYAKLKRERGELHPQGQASGFARRTATGFSAVMTLTNPEPKPIELTERRLAPIFADTSAIVASLPVEKLNPAIIIKGKQTISIPLAVTFAQIPVSAVGFSVYFGAQSPGGEKVRVNAHFDLEPRQRPVPRPIPLGPHSPALGLLEQAVHADLHPGETGITLSQLREAGGPALAAFEAARPALNNVQHVAAVAAAAPPEKRAELVAAQPIASNVLAASKINLALHFAPSPVHVPLGPFLNPAAPEKVGDECDPDNPPSQVPAGFVCQATTEQRTVLTPGRFMNARKGDVVLAPGGNGLIGGLLTHVAYPQLYSHSGIMTRNYDQITHCTASSDRMQAYPVGSIPTDGPEPVDGFRVDAVKYGWPGTITQTVENAVNGEPFNDPEGGHPYNMQCFDGSADAATIAGSWKIIPPLVVKPDPMVETEALRQQLHQVADDAAAHTGKFHYRFYGYTDPTIGRNTTAPAGVGWASGTIPGVCSAFIWLMMKRNGMHLACAGDTVAASDLSVAQTETGAKVGPATPDGLYLYSASERASAGQWLHDQIYNQATDTIGQKAGILGGLVEAFTKLATHVSNEILNAFALDQVQTDDDNEGWASPGDASAVSPDNIMLWNGPSAPTPGPFGYAEPLAYREPRYDTVTVSRWRQVLQTGNLSGQVTFEGKPVPGATVQLYDGKSSGTDANGHYAIANVPYGHYVAKTQKEQQDRSFLSANPSVNVEAPNVTANIALLPPPDVYRTIMIDGKIHTHYTYHIIIKTQDDSGDLPFHKELDLGPNNTHAETQIEHDVKDAHAVLHISLDYQAANKAVLVTFAFSLHDQRTQKSFLVGKDAWQGWQASCSANNDDSHVDFTVANRVKQA
jgi:hypothetical protein